MRTELIQIFTGLIGTVGFAILFNIKGNRLVASAIGGLLSWSVFLLLGLVIQSEAIRYFLISVMISIYADLIARLLKTPTTTVLMVALVPLIPGGSLYYTMAYAWGSDLEMFMTKAISTLKLAGALALGIVLTAMVMRAFYATKRILNKEKKEISDGNN